MFGRVVQRFPDIMAKADFRRAILLETPPQSAEHSLVRLIFFPSQDVNLVGHIVHVDVDDGGCVVTTTGAGRG